MPDIVFATIWTRQTMHMKNLTEKAPSMFSSTSRVVSFMVFYCISLTFAFELLVNWVGLFSDNHSTKAMWSTWDPTSSHGAPRSVHHCQSSTEAEDKSMERRVVKPSSPTLWCDNLVANPIFHACNKHMEIDYHFMHKQVVAHSLQTSSSP